MEPYLWQPLFRWNQISGIRYSDCICRFEFSLPETPTFNSKQKNSGKMFKFNNNLENNALLCLHGFYNTIIRSKACDFIVCLQSDLTKKRFRFHKGKHQSLFVREHLLHSKQKYFQIYHFSALFLFAFSANLAGPLSS